MNILKVAGAPVNLNDMNLYSKLPLWVQKNSFVLISFLNAHLVVTRSMIQFGKHCGPKQFIQQLLYDGHGILVFQDINMEPSIINT